MEQVNRLNDLQALCDSMDTLIVFAEQKDDFLLAAKLDEARVYFADRYMVSVR